MTRSGAVFVASCLTCACAPRPSALAPGAEATVTARPTAPAAPSTAASAMPSASAGADAPTSVNDAERWAARLRSFYGELTRDPARRAAAFRALFAPRLARYVALTDVSRTAALAAVERFFASHTAPSYALVGPAPRVEAIEHAGARATRVTFTLDARWDTEVPARWAELVSKLADAHVTTASRFDVELRATPSGEVHYYAETLAPRRERWRVARATHGYAVPFAEGCWSDPGALLPREALARGTLVEPTGSSVLIFDCGPPTSIERVRFGSKELWVLTALYELVDNPNGGRSLGGVDFVEREPL